MAEPVAVRIITDDREGPIASCRVLISDHAIDELGVKIEKHGQGLWRFEEEQEIRSSVPHQFW